MFFKSQPIQPALESALKEAYAQEATPELAGQKASATARSVLAQGSGLSPQWATFIAAAVVFLILLFAAWYVGAQADAQPADVDTQLRALSKTVQELLVGWSGAVIGLIAGEAVGKKS